MHQRDTTNSKENSKESQKEIQSRNLKNPFSWYYCNCAHELGKMLTAIIIVARVQPGTSKGITDLLLPQPSSGLRNVSGPSSFPLLQNNIA